MATENTANADSATLLGGEGQSADSSANVSTPPPGDQAAAAQKQGEGAAGTQKPDGEKKPDAPAEFDPKALKVPDGFERDEAVLGEFAKTAKELGLKQDGAQKLFDLYASQAQAAQKKADEAVAAEHAKWLETLKADKEFGGQAFDGNVAHVKRAMTKYASPELRKFFDETGLGNHPELVKFAARIGKAMAEDSVGGTTGGGPAGANDEEARLRKLYPTMFPKKE